MHYSDYFTFHSTTDDGLFLITITAISCLRCREKREKYFIIKDLTHILKRQADYLKKIDKTLKICNDKSINVGKPSCGG